MRQHVATFANFVCRFGEEKVLLDYAEEVVLPAFLDSSLIRSYGSTHFFFYETELVKLVDDDNDPVIGLSGRFIKNMHLTRQQVFDSERGLIHDEATMASAPSAHFLLILNNHRLVYFPETTHAPTMSMFRSTVHQFLRRKHTEFINRNYSTLRQEDDSKTKKELRSEHPEPSLVIIPISGDEEIEAFLNRYSLLKKIEIRLVTPNDEIDGEELFNDIREYLGPLQPESTKVETRNPDGLNLEQALPRLQAATANANQEVRLSGKDQEGNDLKGDNHEFQISAPVTPIPPTRRGLTRKLFRIFEGLRESGAIRLGTQSDSVSGKIRNLLRLF